MTNANAAAWNEHSTLDSFIRDELADCLRDIAEHGADAGWPHITYYSDTTALFDKYAEEITEALATDAEEYGYKSAAEFIGTFNLASDADTETGRKNLLVWYMVERIAHSEEWE